MKKIRLFSIILLTGYFLFSGCSKDKDDTGQVVFWNDVTSELGYVVVVMEDATSGNITFDYESAPECNDATGCFIYSNSPGTYSYTASEADGDGDGNPDHTWEGTVTITSNGCTSVRLTAN